MNAFEMLMAETPVRVKTADPKVVVVRPAKAEPTEVERYQARLCDMRLREHAGWDGLFNALKPVNLAWWMKHQLL